MNYLRLDCGLSHGRGWTFGLYLRQLKFFRERMGEALHFIAPVDHQGLGKLDGGGVGRIEVEHRRRSAGIEFLFAFLAQ